MKKKRPTEVLEEWLREKSVLKNAKALEPLPATRVLGEKFGVSHGTAFRLLCALEREGLIWRHDNGRFYPALAGKVLGRPKPLAVMLRRMASWSSLCREVMEGFTDECGELERPVLLFHNKDLLVQDTPSSGLRITSSQAQKDFLRDFFLLQGDSIGGVLFDEVWRDEALRDFVTVGVPLVSFYRPGVSPRLGGVGADFAAGALLAMSHLLASGYEKIFLLNPWPNYESARLFLSAARNVYREIAGREFPASQEVELHDSVQYKAFLRKLVSSRHRFGLICPEDNISCHLAQDLESRGVALGKRHGLVSVMGTFVAKTAGLTCVRYDYHGMGRRAARMLCEGKPESVLLEPELCVGLSTQS